MFHMHPSGALSSAAGEMLVEFLAFFFAYFLVKFFFHSINIVIIDHTSNGFDSKNFLNNLKASWFRPT